MGYPGMTQKWTAQAKAQQIGTLQASRKPPFTAKPRSWMQSKRNGRPDRQVSKHADSTMVQSMALRFPAWASPKNSQFLRLWKAFHKKKN